jgi:hypothetical protein
MEYLIACPRKVSQLAKLPTIIREWMKSNFFEKVHGSSTSSITNDRLGGTLKGLSM